MKTLNYDDLFASNVDKDSSEFGLKIANAIAQDWFDGGMVQANCGYGLRRDWIRQRRIYALGKQDLKPYKDIIAREDNDLSLYNLDWRPVNIIGKFNKIVADGIDEDAYDVSVKAVDNNSIEAMRVYERNLRKDMLAKQMYDDAYDMLGIDMRPTGFVPQDDEELEMHMALKPKMKIEIGEEVLIDHVFASNGWDIIKPQVNNDLVCIGIGAVKIETDKIEGIKARWVDPEYLVHSYVDTPFFKNAYYFGELRTMTIAELKRDSQFSNATLMEIANKYAHTNGGIIIDYSGDHLEESVLNYKINILEFCFKTTKEIVYKKTTKDKGIKLTKKDANYNPPKRNDYGRVDKSVNTWYEGSYIIGTDHLYNYQQCENIAKDNLNKVMGNYIVYAPEIYKGNLTSFSSSIEPIADKMLYTDLKLQHLIAEIKPDGAEINMDKLYELAADTKSNEKDIISLFAVKGMVLSKTTTDEGGQEIRTKAVEPIKLGVPDNIMELVKIWEHYYNVIREITGINPFRDGTQRPDTLVGVQKMGLLQSNIATKFLVRGSIFITKKAAECITSRIKTIFKYSNHLKRIYEDAISQENVAVLEALKKRHIHSFGIHIIMRPTEEEIEDLNQNIGLAIQAGDIKVEDKIEVTTIGNFKKANAYLRYRSRKRREELQEDAIMQSQVQSQQNQQAAEVAAEEARNNMMFEAELEIQKEAKFSIIRIQEEIAKAQIAGEIEGAEQANKRYIAEINAIAARGLKEFERDEKRKLQDRNNSQQSELIAQRKNDGEPINFEADSKFSDLLKSFNSNIQ